MKEDRVVVVRVPLELLEGKIRSGFKLGCNGVPDGMFDGWLACVLEELRQFEE